MFSIGNIRGCDPGAGTVAIDGNERVGRLREDRFAFEGERVVEVVLMGHAEMWAVMREREEVPDRRAGTMVIVSHDRRFRSAVCTHRAAA